MDERCHQQSNAAVSEISLGYDDSVEKGVNVMASTAKPLTVHTMTYARLAEMLRPFGFEQKPTEGDHCLLQHEKEKDWVIIFPASKRFNKRVETSDLLSLRAHLDHWGLLHTRTIEELVEKLQE